MLAFLVNTFHFLVIFFVLFGPFYFNCSPLILFLHIVLSFSLLIHWYYNNDTCCLSELEAYLSGKQRVDTFIHGFIAPLYNTPLYISEKNWSNFCYFLTFTTMLFSFYFLINCYKTKKIIENIKKGNIFIEENIKLLL